MDEAEIEHHVFMREIDEKTINSLKKITESQQETIKIKTEMIASYEELTLFLTTKMRELEVSLKQSNYTIIALFLMVVILTLLPTIL